MKRRFPYKILLSACLSAALVLGPAAYAYASSPVTVSYTHLGEKGCAT